MRRAWALGALAALALLGACGSCPSEPEGTASTSAGGEEGACVERAPVDTPMAEAPPAEVRALADAPRRQAPPGTATIALLAQGENAFLGRLEMAPNASVPEHQDPDEEYIHVLEGHGTMWIDGTEHAVTPGATIYMPAGATVRFQNGEERMVAIQVFAGPGSAAKYDRWTAVE